MKTQGNTVLITGGSAGIGLEFAKQMLQLGNQVIVTGRDEQKLKNVSQEFHQIHTIRNDISKPEDLESLFTQVSSRFPNLNILINNAGIGRTLDLRNQHDSETMTEELATNLIAPIQAINKFMPLLKKQSQAAIVNVTSALAFSPFPVVPLYSASKAGLHSFTVSLRAQLHHTNIKVFEIAPPTTQTDMIKGFSAADLKGVKAMTAADMVSYSLKAFEKDQFEICPGQAAQLRFMSRFFPGFILKQMSKSLKGRQSSFN